ncbi:MAG: acetolactate synthase [Ardenticatenaceae bacterium]|nr:acetolactate synthase [Ardenticatenaceae bacterium]
MTRLTGGEAIVQTLITHGVDTLFGLPGVQNDYFFIPLHDAQDKIRVIHPRHEQGAAYMAMGYALSSEKEGVYSVVPGPGVLNTMGALSTAWATNAKLLCLTGQIATKSIGRGFGELHEIPDQLGMLRAITKWAERVRMPAEASYLVSEAFRQLNSGRPRPVAIEVPPDVLSQKTEVKLENGRLPLSHPPVDYDAINEAAKLMGAAKNPMILVGGGAHNAGAEVQELAEMLQAPVIANRMGKGVVSSHHPLSHNIMVGYHYYGKADLVIGIGSRMSTVLHRWGVSNDVKVIQIDVDPEEHGRFTKTAVSLMARAEDVLPVLNDSLAKYNQKRPSRAEELAEMEAKAVSDFSYLEPQISFMHAIRDVLPEDGIHVDEMTQVSYVSRMYWPAYQPRTYISTGYQGTLGYGFLTALGVKVANPDKPVVSLNGDGGFMFGVQELATAVQHNINLVSIVFNDNAYGNVRRMQRKLYDNRIIASDLRNPDFVKLAESFGALGLRAHTADDLRRALEQGFAANVPTLIEVPVGELPDPSRFWSLPRVR